MGLKAFTAHHSFIFNNLTVKPVIKTFDKLRHAVSCCYDKRSRKKT